MIHRKVSFPLLERWKARPVYQGYYIPYTTVIDSSGVPNFRAIEPSAVLDCVMNRVCGVCGRKIGGTGWVAFIGGEMCISAKQFVDPGMHPECAYYAAETCPYLSRPDGGYAKNQKDCPGVELRDIPEVATVRPKRMAIYFCKVFTAEIRGSDLRIHVGTKPHLIDWDAMPQSMEAVT